jgi:hypothetical protein
MNAKEAIVYIHFKVLLSVNANDYYDTCAVFVNYFYEKNVSNNIFEAMLRK